MKKYIAAFAALIVGFLLLGPLGAVLGIVIWVVVSKNI